MKFEKSTNKTNACKIPKNNIKHYIYIDNRNKSEKHTDNVKILKSLHNKSKKVLPDLLNKGMHYVLIK